MKSTARILTILLLMILLGANATQAQIDLVAGRDLPAVPLGTAFSYQGQLKNVSGPVNGSCDLRFELWDAATGGSQLGMTETLSAVPVTRGLFTVQLNSDGAFGPDAFTGEARWLAVAVRCPAGSGSYAPLDPRQALTAAPYALYAPAAGAAPWSGLTGVPAGFADNLDNDELGALSCSAGQVPQWNGTAWTCAAVGASYANVLVVARSGGQFTSIQAALDSITGTVTNRYLVWVAPGTYSETVRMEPYVDVEGAGEGLTVITAPGSGTLNTGTVVGASNAQLRALTVRNTGGATYAVAIYNGNADVQIRNVTATAAGASGNPYGVYNTSGSPILVDVTATATGGYDAYAIYSTGSTVLIQRARATAWAASHWNTGITSWNSSNAIIEDSVAVVGGGGEGNAAISTAYATTLLLVRTRATASGGSYSNYGLIHQLGSTATVVDFSAVATASGGSFAIAIRNSGSSALIRDSSLTATGGIGGFAVSNDTQTGSFTVTIHNSQLNGVTNALRNDRGAFTTAVGASQLAGGPVYVGAGTVTCAGVYDENFVFYASTCP